MRSRRAYSRVAVKNVNLNSLWDRAISYGGRGTVVGLDIAKYEIVVMIRWSNGTFEQSWSVKNSGEIELLISILCELRDKCDGLRVAMESTGTYGDAVRYAATTAKLDIQRVSGKAVSDYKEIFDGVPSQHDSKDAAMIAELAAMNKSKPWPFREKSESAQSIDFNVTRMEAFRGQAVMWRGRLEGMLARHWPELTDTVQTSAKSTIEMLAYYGSPADLASDPEAANRLKAWSRGKLAPERIDEILESAKTTQGIPMSRTEKLWVQEIVAEVRSAEMTVKTCEKELKSLAKDDEEIQLLTDIGISTMCVIRSKMGSPKNFDSAGAFVKGIGLNLKELSSGKQKGELAISKRGPNVVRRWLYFAALRAIQREEIKPWYLNKQKRDKHGKMKGLIGVMRKLARAIWHVANTGDTFDWGKLFPGKPLNGVNTS